jgi:hypothetical protein
VQYLRERGYIIRVGRVVVTTLDGQERGGRNAFEIGRDYQRGVLSGKVES